MISKTFQAAMLGLFVTALAAAAVFLHWANARMRARLAAIPRPAESVANMRAGNAQLRRAVAQAGAGGEAGAAAMRVELERVRDEVTRRERQAARRHAELVTQAAREADELATNREPRSGLVRLEHFQNAGRATPTAACQTLIWAVMKGDDAVLDDLLVLSPSVRAGAGAMIAGLPDAVRATWTPEKLARLYFTAVITDVSAAQIVRETREDATRASVTLRIPGIDEAKSRLALQSGPNGWVVLVPEHAMDVVRRKISTDGKQ